MRPSGDHDTLPGITILEQSPIIIEKLLFDQGQETLGWKPALDRWSISEVLAHLADVETLFRNRARSILEEKEPRIEPYDQNAVAATGKYSGGKGRDHLHTFCHERDMSLSRLRYVPAAAGARTAQHAELGRVTLAEMMNEWAFHDLGHIRQIAELLRARLYFPKMGGWKRYYSVKP